MKFDEFTTAYIEAALWSSTDDDGEPLDKNFDERDIAMATLKKMAGDCEKFQREFFDDIVEHSGGSGRNAAHGNLARAGHDFWLTRNRHGAGFWDGDWDEPLAKKMTKASHRFGEFDLYVGDDDKIHGS